MKHVIISLLAATAFGADPTDAELERGFRQTVKPFTAAYCTSCHSGEKSAAQFDLTRYGDLASVVQDHAHWALVLEKLDAGQMPPAGSKQPPAGERRAVTEWIRTVRHMEARKNAGDPGVVLARRLSNAEYDYTIRDLTGVDLRPTREFPVDPANPAGFDNSGESLGMSPALLSKYLQAAREVSNHAVLKPDGIAFAAHSMLVETDRDKYCVKQIVDFYERQPTDFGAYFEAAWRFKHRSALGRPNATLAEVAAAGKVSPKYLAAVWKYLERSKEQIGPGAKLQSMWRALPAPRGALPAPRAGFEGMRDFVVSLRRKTALHFQSPSVKGLSRTSQPLLMWRNRQYAAHRTRFDRAALQVEGEVPSSSTPDPVLHVPAGQRARFEEAFARFAAVFPDAFYIRERGRYFPDNTRDTGRHLSAGFHNLMGYFRDDQPLYDLILDERGRAQLDAMWRELDFVASAGIRTFIQFYLSESGEARGSGRESEGRRPTGTEITSPQVIEQVKAAYLARIKDANDPVANQAVIDHFDWVNREIRWVERARIEAEPEHLVALEQFAARAYRRPLTETEKAGLRSFYRELRSRDGLAHEDAIRDTIAYILMSPDFCYRIDLVETAAGSTHPLPDHALASRLSYFLWSSMPDSGLLARAVASELRKPGVLAAEARRMLKEHRANALATEFAGNWLDFRRFEEHNAVDRERYPMFGNELRQAMFEEAVRFIGVVVRQDRSILDLLYANYTFVNPVLAKHYGMTGVAVRPGEWTRVDDAHRYGRGGLLPMSVFLTKNAPGLRTSPVKRGYWVVKNLLGEQIPPPPAVVPELPRDEAKLDLPLRDMLAKHRSETSCASCHARFDAFGLALEGYGPVGERRTKDLAGRDVDARAEFPGGIEAGGLEGLRSYIRTHREKDFVDNICRKLLAYALGRSLQLSDEPAIEQMGARLAASGYRFSTLVESIVSSPQFLNKRTSGNRMAKR